MKSLTKFVIFSFASLIIYTIVAQLITIKTGGIEMSTLTTCFFGAFGGEVLMCALIKVFKLKGGNNGDNTNASAGMQCDDGTGYGSNQNDDPTV